MSVFAGVLSWLRRSRSHDKPRFMPIPTLEAGLAGQVIEITMTTEEGEAMDLARSSRALFHFQRPSGIPLVIAGTISENGIVRYVTRTSDLDETGDWLVTVTVEHPSGKLRSDLARFRVIRRRR
jgi:hypothetical protein